jgi:hypothetical protein
VTHSFDRGLHGRPIDAPFDQIGTLGHGDFGACTLVDIRIWGLEVAK